MVEIKPLDSFPRAVYVDGIPLRKQTLDDPIVLPDSIVQVDCLTDEMLPGGEDPHAVPYQAKPFVQFKNEKGFTVTRFYLKS